MKEKNNKKPPETDLVSPQTLITVPTVFKLW